VNVENGAAPLDNRRRHPSNRQPPGDFHHARLEIGRETSTRRAATTACVSPPSEIRCNPIADRLRSFARAPVPSEDGRLTIAVSSVPDVISVVPGDVRVVPIAIHVLRRGAPRLPVDVFHMPIGYRDLPIGDQ
jgi:hypothetical protein